MKTHSEHDMSEHPGLDEPHPGKELRTARERAGIERESMAERLRLAPAQLDALERDDYSELPPPAFVRGYFRAYARELGLDPEEYIAAYNRSGVSAQDPEIRSGGVTEPASSGRGGLIGLLLIALVAAAGIGAWWYQQRMGAGGGDTGAADSVEDERAAADAAEADSQAKSDRGDPATDAGETEATETEDTEPETSDTDSSDKDSSDTDSSDTDSSDTDSSDTDSSDTDSTGSDAGAGVENGSDEAGSGGNGTGTPSGASAEDDSIDVVDVDAASALDVEAGGAMTEAARDGNGDAGDDADGAASGAGADDGEPSGEELQQPVVATAADESPENADDAGASGATGDSGTDNATTTAEPGATSPAATDSPTRAATDAARSGPDEVTLEFSSRSWLEVYDDRDRELVYTLYFGSEPITLQGWAPFEIFLGNSPAVTVRFNGVEVDKSAFNRGNNTARFVVDASGVRAP